MRTEGIATHKQGWLPSCRASKGGGTRSAHLSLLPLAPSVTLWSENIQTCSESLKTITDLRKRAMAAYLFRFNPSQTASISETPNSSRTINSGQLLKSETAHCTQNYFLFEAQDEEPLAASSPKGWWPRRNVNTSVFYLFQKIIKARLQRHTSLVRPPKPDAKRNSPSGSVRFRWGSDDYDKKSPIIKCK